MKKIISLVLVLSLTLSINVFANELLISPNPNESLKFVDMPNDWSTEALQKAVDDGIIKGYEQEDGMYIKASNNMTRAEFATIINRVFNSIEKADISMVTDVDAKDWFVNEIAKSIKMGVMAIDVEVRPNDGIIRQEAFTMLARAFNLSSKNVEVLNSFSDGEEIQNWAQESIAALVELGYVKGSENKIHPNDYITRAEVATMITRLVEHYIQNEGEATVNTQGNLVINTQNVTLNKSVIKGDLIIGDGVGQGEVIIKDSKIEGRLLIRAGGENSIEMLGNTQVGDIVIAKTIDGNIRVYVEDRVQVDNVVINEANGEVIVEGEFNDVKVESSDVKVVFKNAEIENVIVSAENVEIEVEKKSTISNVEIKAENAKVEGKGTVTKVAVESNNANIEVEDAKVVVDKDVEGTIVFEEEVKANTEIVAKDEETSVGGGGSAGGSAPTVTPTINVTIDENGYTLTRNTNFTASNKTIKFVINDEAYTIQLSKSLTSITSGSLTDIAESLLGTTGKLQQFVNVINAIGKDNVVKILEDAKSKLGDVTSNDTRYIALIDTLIVELNKIEAVNSSALYTMVQNILTENSAGTLDSEVSDVIKAILNNDTATLATLANDMAKILNAVISK